MADVQSVHCLSDEVIGVKRRVPRFDEEIAQDHV